MSPAAARLAHPSASVPRSPQRRALVRPAAPAPRLRVLTAPARATSRPSFVVGCAALLVSSLLAVLVINIVLSRGAYEENQLELRQIALTESEQALSEELAVQSAPSTLSARARELGMIPNASPAFIRLSDGRILGSPTPADPKKAAAFAEIPAAALAAPGEVSEADAVAAQAAADAAADAAAAAAAPAVPDTTAAVDAPVDPPASPADPGDGAVRAGGDG